MKCKASYLFISVLLLMSITGCKKNDTNDPNIEDKIINKTFTTNGNAARYGADDSIDVNGDGTYDIKFLFGGVSNADTSFYGGACLKGQVVSNTQNLGGNPLILTTSISNGTSVSSASATWNDFGFLGATLISSKIGFAGDGDNLIGFRFNPGDGYHYGWMKLNISSDYKILLVKELAYHKTVNTEIQAGAR